MIRKGIRFQHTRRLVMLNVTKAQAEGMIAKGLLPHDPGCYGEHSTIYVIPGRAIPEGVEPPKNAVRTHYLWGSGAPVWAVPLKVTGWSRTNMPYVKEGSTQRVLWFEDGQGYSARM